MYLLPTMNTQEYLEKLDTKFTEIEEMSGTREDCVESWLAELRIDMYKNMCTLSRKIKENKAQAFNNTIAIWILYVTIISSFVTYLAISQLP